MIPQGNAKARGAAFTGRFGEYRRKIGLPDDKMDFHSLRATLATDLANIPGFNVGWADEITGHESEIRRSVRTLYTKGVLLGHLKDTLDRVRFRGAWAGYPASLASRACRFPERRARSRIL